MKRHFAFSCIACLIACGGSQTPPPETPPGAGESEPPPPEPMPGAPEAVPQTFGEQVALGQQLYGEHCAGCHGDAGQGTTDAPAVVGLETGALPLDPPASAKHRKAQFKTVADIAQFVVATMPAKKPGSLTSEQYWAILAFDLKANGIDLGDKKLDSAVAATLEVPR